MRLYIFYDTDGGGLYVAGLMNQGGKELGLRIIDSKLTGNLATAKSGAALTSLLVEGGGIYLIDTVADIKSSEIRNNKGEIQDTSSVLEHLRSQVDGGGITLLTSDGATHASSLILENCTLAGNEVVGVVQHFGAGLYKDLLSLLKEIANFIFNNDVNLSTTAVGNYLCRKGKA